MFSFSDANSAAVLFKLCFKVQIAINPINKAIEKSKVPIKLFLKFFIFLPY